MRSIETWFSTGLLVIIQQKPYGLYLPLQRFEGCCLFPVYGVRLIITIFDVADRANTGCKWKFHFISFHCTVFVFNYLFTSHTATSGKNRKLGHDWRLRGSVELSRVGQWEHSHDATQLNWSRCKMKKIGALLLLVSWSQFVHRLTQCNPAPAACRPAQKSSSVILATIWMSLSSYSHVEETAAGPGLPINGLLSLVKIRVR